MSVSLTPTITTVGLSALLNAEKTGYDANLTHIVVGDANGVGYTIDPLDANPTLVNERDRVLVSSEKVSANTLRFTATISGTEEYWIREVGLLLDSGELFAVYAIPEATATTPDKPLAFKATGIDLSFNIDITLTAEQASNVTVNGKANLYIQHATENQPGLIDLATAEQVAIGTDINRAITPSTLNSRFSIIPKAGKSPIARVSGSIDYQWLGDRWSKRPRNMPTARHSHASSVLNGEIYVIGGHNGSNGLTSVEAYSRKRQRWSTKAPLSGYRYAFASCVVDGAIYIIGGSSTDVETYKPRYGWSVTAPMQTVRYRLTVSVVNGIIYVIGGDTGTPENVMSIVEAYDPKTDSWSTKAPMPTARTALTSCVVGGIIYTIGGYDGSKALPTVELYDPRSDSWYTRASMPTARSYLTSSEINETICVIGGNVEDGKFPLPTVELYDPKSDRWYTKPFMPTARRGLTSHTIKNKIYGFGGINGTGSLNTVEDFVPYTY